MRASRFTPWLALLVCGVAAATEGKPTQVLSKCTNRCVERLIEVRVDGEGKLCQVLYRRDDEPREKLMWTSKDDVEHCDRRAKLLKDKLAKEGFVCRVVRPSESTLPNDKDSLWEPATTTGTVAAEGPSDGAKRWRHFTVAAMVGTQASGGNSYTAQIGWAPEWDLSDAISVRAPLSFSLHKVRGPKVVPVTELGFQAVYRTAGIELGAGPGLQTFFNGEGVRPQLAVQISLPIRETLFLQLDRLYAGYSAYFGDSLIHQYTAGAGITF